MRLSPDSIALEPANSFSSILQRIDVLSKHSYVFAAVNIVFT